jgi:hypothetical protein
MRTPRGVRWTIRGTLIVAACAGFWRLGRRLVTMASACGWTNSFSGYASITSVQDVRSCNDLG